VRHIEDSRKEKEMMIYRGWWRISVIGKDSAWDQRVVVTGASNGSGAIAGVVGTTQTVDGDQWNLTIEHNDGSGWRENEGVLPDPIQEIGANMRQVVRSKDHYTPSDTDPNDLVIQVDKVGPMFQITVRPYAVDAQSLLMLADGVFVGINGLQYMGVEIKNTWGEAYEDELLFDISDMGRATLASFGIVVIDSWSQASLMATQQTLVGRRIRIPPLAIGETTIVYFQVDASACRRGKPKVEFVLMNLGLTPDPANSMRHNSRAIFIADIGFDRQKGTAVARIPEGTLTLKLKSMAVDLQALNDLCRQVKVHCRRRKSGCPSLEDDLRQILAQTKGNYCDQRMLRQMILLLCRCLKDSSERSGCRPGNGDGKGHGWERVCLPGAIWLPLKFDYGVEIDGGFTGQYGPLPFQDPWWKVVLLIIAAIAWCVGAIESVVADETGWGNVGDHPRKIGTVGASARTTTDACIIEFDGSRPAVQDVADVITGEPNNSPIVGVDTVIPVDPQVAFPSLTPADVIGKYVYKSGSRTGITHGIISSIGNFTQVRDESHPDLVLPNQFSIGADPAFGEEMFDDHGDSGSIVLSREPDTMNQVVGLLHSAGGGTSPIQDVLSALGLKLR
jgi:hypothetical protein